MKVRELQAQLSNLAPELDVVCYSEDEKLLAEGRGFVLLNVVTVSATQAHRLRLDDGTPHLTFNKRSASAAIAVLEVTLDF
jgi:hypothetical protein